MFETSPQVAPLLVRLYENNELYKLPTEDKPFAQSELISAVADLLDIDLSDREKELLADVLIGLMRQAEKDLRVALSDRVAALDNVPLRLALHLAHDEIDVAAPVLKLSPVLNELDLIYMIKSQGPEYWQAIAARKDLKPELIDLLAETKEKGTAITLAENNAVTLTSHALDIFSGMARGDEDIARPLLMRKNLPAETVQKLYQYVGAELKAHIKKNYTDIAAKIEDAADDVISEMADDAPANSYLPTKSAVESARKMAERGMLTMNVMLDTLENGQIGPFIAQFARYSGLPAGSVHDILRQRFPKKLAVLCRAHGIVKGDFTRIYLLTHRMRAPNQAVDQKEMFDLIAYFDRVPVDKARRIMKRL